MPNAFASSLCCAASLIAGAALAEPVAKTSLDLASPGAITSAARAYVETHSTAPNPELGQISRWHGAVCAQVEGLAQQAQADQVKARITEVAQAVGLPAAKPGCKANVEVVFTDNPQGTMDNVAKTREDLLGYYHKRDRDRLKTVNHPIQSWYKTATLSNRADAGLDFPGFDNDSGAGSAQSPAGAVRTDDPEVGLPNGCGDNPRFTACLSSQFSNVFIVVDSKALQGKTLGQVSEYVTMLALSQPKSLDGCTPLPSIFDLAAKCGRGAPGGLTPADAAYLTALYASDSQAKGDSQRSDITGRMSTMLIKAGAPAAGG